MFQLTCTGSPWKASPLLSASLRLASRSRVAMVRRSVNCVRCQQRLMTRTGQGIHPVSGPSPAPLMWTSQGSRAQDMVKRENMSTITYSGLSTLLRFMLLNTSTPLLHMNKTCHLMKIQVFAINLDLSYV